MPSEAEGQQWQSCIPAMPDFSVIPSIEQLRQRPAVRALEARFGADATVDALRAAAAEVADAIALATRRSRRARRSSAGIEAAAAARLGDAFRPSLAAGHQRDRRHHPHQSRTRAAGGGGHRARRRRSRAATRRSSTTSSAARRGRRDVHAEALLCRLTGAEAAVVVNNNAAATMIVLAALAAGREVIVSRGELVEIGGGFRVPDVMAQSGAIAARGRDDEQDARGRLRAPRSATAPALILRVHPSNFRIEGFTERPSLAELVALGKKFNIPVAEDLGSGTPRPAPDPRSDRGRTPIPAPSIPALVSGRRRSRRRSRRAWTSAASAATSSSADRRPASSSAARR